MAMSLPGRMADDMSFLIGLFSGLMFGKRLLLGTFVFGIFGQCFKGYVPVNWDEERIG